jgi:serine/threonine protein kinase
VERWGAYEIQSRLGVGGMAEVFVAIRRGDQGFAKRVVLKRVLPAYSDDNEFVRAFLDEARLAAHLEHPAITSVYDFGQHAGSWYMVMELVDGADLRRVLGALRELGQPMPVDLVLLVAQELSRALAYAHELHINGQPAHIIHRDLSPSNVLLSVDGAVKLADFGIARATLHDHKTESGVVKGKVPYMAPEQALGKPMDGRVDLFALGVVLFEALAGRRPYDGNTDLDTLQNAVLGQRPRLADLAPHAPSALVAIVEKLIDPSAAARFATAAEVLDALAPIPPPANAARTLGTLVRRVAEPAPELAATIAQAPTKVEGTLALGETRPTPSSTPDYAVPSAPTRTQPLAPANDIPPTAPSSSSSPITQPTPFTTTSSVPQRAIAAPRRSRAWLAVLTLGSIVAVIVAAIIPWPRSEPATTSSTPDQPVGHTTRTAPGAPLVVEPTSTGTEIEPVAVSASPIDSAADSQRPRGATTVTRRLHAGAQHTEPTQPETIPAVPPPAEPPPPVEAPATVTATESAPQPEPPRTGRLTVVAIPFGIVEIDGRDAGDAPVTAPLRAGEHEIVVRSGGQVERRTVVVEPGSAERTVFRFQSR